MWEGGHTLCGRYIHLLGMLTDFLTTTVSLSLVAGLSDLVGSLTCTVQNMSLSNLD